MRKYKINFEKYDLLLENPPFNYSKEEKREFIRLRVDFWEMVLERY